MAGLWPFSLKVLTRRFLGWRTRFRALARAGAVRDRNVSGLGRDGWALAIATKVLTCRSLRRGARYGRKPEYKWP